MDLSLLSVVLMFLRQLVMLLRMIRFAVLQQAQHQQNSLPLLPKYLLSNHRQYLLPKWSLFHMFPPMMKMMIVGTTAIAKKNTMHLRVSHGGEMDGTTIKVTIGFMIITKKNMWFAQLRVLRHMMIGTMKPIKLMGLLRLRVPQLSHLPVLRLPLLRVQQQLQVLCTQS